MPSDMNKYRCIFAGDAGQQIDVEASNTDAARKQAMEHFGTTVPHHITVIFLEAGSFK